MFLRGYGSLVGSWAEVRRHWLLPGLVARQVLETSGKGGAGEANKKERKREKTKFDDDDDDGAEEHDRMDRLERWMREEG